MTQQKSSTPIWLIYFFQWITGLIFLATEKNDADIRWHAANSFTVFAGLCILSIVCWILSFIPFIGILFTIIGVIVWIANLILWILLMVKGSQGEKVRIPVATDFAESTVINWFK